MADSLVLRIGTWNEVRGDHPALQAFGMDKNGKSYYISIPHIESFIVDRQLLDEDVDEIVENFQLDPSEIRLSEHNPRAVIFRNPILSQAGSSLHYTIDPAGMKPSLGWWQNITSEFIRIGNFQYLNKSNYSVCDYSITIHPSNIEGIKSDDPEALEFKSVGWFADVLLYDLEVYSPSGNFTEATKLSDEVIAISVVTLRNGIANAYLLLNGTTLPNGSEGWNSLDINSIRSKELFTTEEFEYQVVVLPSEEKLLDSFFNTLNTFRPKTLVDYNGKSYDLPYLIQRTKLLNLQIPPFSQITNLKSYPTKNIISTTFEEVEVNSLVMPGVVHVDLLYYYRQYLPTLINHKLDTVSSHVTGKGKTGLDIDTFYQALEDEDVELLTQAAEYSLRDTIALYELWIKGVGESIFRVAASLSLNPDEFTGTPQRFLVSKTICRHDPGLFITGFDYIKQSQPRVKPEPGIYSDVHVYDYSPAFLEILHRQGGSYTTLAKALERAPLDYITEIFFSPGIFNEKMHEQISRIYETFRSIPLTISFQDGILYSNGSTKGTWLREIDRKKVIVFPSSASRIELDSRTDEIVYKGQSLLSKPKFKLLQDYIEDFIRGWLNDDDLPDKPDPTKADIEDLIMKRWIKGSSDYSDIPRNKVVLSLAKQVEKEALEPVTKMRIEWIYSKKGPLVIFDSDDIEDVLLDIAWYRKEINDVHKRLNDLLK